MVVVPVLYLLPSALLGAPADKPKKGQRNLASFVLFFFPKKLTRTLRKVWKTSLIFRFD